MRGILFDVCYAGKTYGVLDIISTDGTFLAVNYESHGFKFLSITECIFNFNNINSSDNNAKVKIDS